jgi:hypothetical protein
VLPTDCAWAAGFLEADGCFLIFRRSGAAQQRQGPRPAINAYQIDARPLERLVELFGGRIYQQQRTGRGVKQWQLLAHADVVACLTAIIPYLVGKREHAETLLAYCLGPGLAQPGRRVTEAQRAARAVYAERLSAMNRGLCEVKLV